MFKTYVDKLEHSTESIDEQDRASPALVENYEEGLDSFLTEYQTAVKDSFGTTNRSSYEIYTEAASVLSAASSEELKSRKKPVDPHAISWAAHLANESFYRSLAAQSPAELRQEALEILANCDKINVPFDEDPDCNVRNPSSASAMV